MRGLHRVACTEHCRTYDLRPMSKRHRKTPQKLHLAQWQSVPSFACKTSTSNTQYKVDRHTEPSLAKCIRIPLPKYLFQSKRQCIAA